MFCEAGQTPDLKRALGYCLVQLIGCGRRGGCRNVGRFAARETRHPSAHRYVAHACVEATVRYAVELGYEVTLVKDADRGLRG
jgi:hypothetical protein